MKCTYSAGCDQEAMYQCGCARCSQPGAPGPAQACLQHFTQVSDDHFRRLGTDGRWLIVLHRPGPIRIGFKGFRVVSPNVAGPTGAPKGR